MSRDNERIIFLFNEADIADRELLKQLINAGASARTLGTVIERMRISEDAINYLGEDEHRLYNTPLIGLEAIRSGSVGMAVRPNRVPMNPIEFAEQGMLDELKRQEVQRLSEEAAIRQSQRQAD
jgi:hypothetical protein